MKLFDDFPGTRPYPQRSGCKDAARGPQTKPLRSIATVLAIGCVALLLIAPLVQVLAGTQEGARSPTPGFPKSTLTGQGTKVQGAPPGYGLTNPGALQAHAPIFISGPTGFTAANGVRSGTGTILDPFIISDWFIDGNLYAGTPHMIWIENTNLFVVIQNVKISGLSAGTQWSGIKIGDYPAIAPTLNIVVRHTEIDSRHAYGIWVNEGAVNVRLEANLVVIDANRDWVYGLTFMRNVHGSQIVNNYVNAGTSSGKLTVGIQVGDYEVTPIDRPVTGAVVERNTVTNATAASIVSDDTRGTLIRYNLIYHNYPGMLKVGSWPVRGIIVEEISQGLFVYGNEIHTVEYGLAIASPFSTYFENTLHDLSFAVYIFTPNAFKETRGTRNDTVYATTYWNVSKSVFTIPAGNGHTVLDVGPGVTPTNFGTILFVTNQTPTSVRYDWVGADVNISMVVGLRTIYDVQRSTYYQNARATWIGAALTLTVSRFTTTNITYRLQSAIAAAFTGANLESSAFYEIRRAGLLISNISTDPSGGLNFTMPTPVSALYSVRFVGPARLPEVDLLSPTNNSYFTQADVPVAWTLSSPGGPVVNATLYLDGASPINVTGSTSITLTAVPDGPHIVQVVAIDSSGRGDSGSTAFTVDTHPPELAILSPIDGSVVNSTDVVVSWTATDAASGISQVEVSLDGGPPNIAFGDSYRLVGLSKGVHTVSVMAFDMAGWSTKSQSTFVVVASTGNGPIPDAIISSITYSPNASALDIRFTTAMNQTSVEQAVQINPLVAYQFEWVNETHMRIVLRQTLTNGATYQLVVNSSARTATGEPLQHPFLFQFLGGDPNSGSTNFTFWSILTIAFISLLLATNWTTAGLLIYRYRQKAARLRRSLERASARAAKPMMVGLRRLAGEPSPSSRGPSSTVRKVQKTHVVYKRLKGT